MTPHLRFSKERLTRELLDEDPRDAAAAQAWLSKWADYASRSWTRRNTAQKCLLALKEAVEKGDVSRDDIPYALHKELPRKCQPEFLLRFAKERGLERWESIIELIDYVKKTCKTKAAALRKLIAEANGTQKEAPRAERKVTRAPRGERQARSAAEDLAKSKRRGPRPRREHRDPLRDLLRSLDKAAVAQLLTEISARYPSRVNGRSLDLPHLTWFEYCWIRDRAGELKAGQRRHAEEPVGEATAKAPRVAEEEPGLRDTHLSRKVGALAVRGIDGHNPHDKAVLEKAWDALTYEAFDKLAKDHFGQQEIVLCNLPHAKQKQYLVAVQQALQRAAYEEEQRGPEPAEKLPSIPENQFEVAEELLSSPKRHVEEYMRDTELSLSVGRLAQSGIDEENDEHDDIVRKACDGLTDEGFEELARKYFGDQDPIRPCELPLEEQRQYLQALRRALQKAAYKELGPPKPRAKQTARKQAQPAGAQGSREENYAQAPAASFPAGHSSGADEWGAADGSFIERSADILAMVEDDGIDFGWM